MVLYGLKTCDTCRKALKALGNPQFVDVRADGLPETLRKRAFDHFGMVLLNSRSTTWRQLDDAERARPPLDLLAAHPALMKRPLIDDGTTLHLGWGPEVRAALGVA